MITSAVRRAHSPPQDKVRRAREYISREEEEKLVDAEQVSRLSWARWNSPDPLPRRIDISRLARAVTAPEVRRGGDPAGILPSSSAGVVKTKTHGAHRIPSQLHRGQGPPRSKTADLIPEAQGRSRFESASPFTRTISVRSLTSREFALPQYRAAFGVTGAGTARVKRCRDSDRDFGGPSGSRTPDSVARLLHDPRALLEELSFDARNGPGPSSLWTLPTYRPL